MSDVSVLENADTITVLDYLSSEILDVKEYSLDELDSIDIDQKNNKDYVWIIEPNIDYEFKK